MNISTKALRTRVLEVLDCLDRGEPVTLTYRGKPRARLVGIGDERGGENAALRALPVFGMWSDRDELDDVDAYVRSLREGRLCADRY